MQAQPSSIPAARISSTSSTSVRTPLPAAVLSLPDQRESVPDVPLPPTPMPSTSLSDSAGLAHDAGNFLVALGLYCDLLSAPGVLRPEHRHYAEELAIISNASSKLIRRLLASGNLAAAQQAMEKVVQQGDRARLIIQRIRDHVRKREPERQIENLSSTIAEASDLALAGVDRGLALTIKVEDGAEAVVIDRIQIQQVLLNLIRNAVEAMAGSARRALSITAVQANEMVEISVRDSGPGLPAAVKERLFEPFFTTKAAGMGVGLSVCRTIVEAHGGTLCAEDGVDGGMVFRLTVPRPADGAPVAAGQAVI